ncbi:MAG: DUF1836 domain-containing protein [Oscillospiraceae bacterium]|nr:DUF1836 domain-containing protein [Oscillospiraceae bacterium]
MRYTSEFLSKALESVKDTPSAALPSIDLYMDQVITMLNKGKSEDNTVTKTMINNYRKQDIIKELDGKKYSREHLIQLLLILQLKTTLTISEIEQVLSVLYQMPQDDHHLKACYDEFLDTMPKMQMTMSDMCESLLPQKQDGFDTLTSLLILSRMEQYIQNMAKTLVQDLFPEE